ncbi:hypothetical protein PISL3812_00184 [Talaromyces islandicus]|uniref:FAD-binding PCMH-type domain-containing protein n=1 Tax=Talaromyces islandicus TaxID=28573 RepID=A0A0U1LII9_TALIS|nr:hypothetical protein PISL3812_00184 [Talaromyces islandicus]
MVQISRASLVKGAAVGLMATTSATSSLGYNCSPGQACWPSNKEWERLNDTLSGNLYRTVPYAATCYYSSPHYDPEPCAVVAEDYKENQPRTEVYGAASGLNWESCLSNTCALNPSNTSQVLSNDCYLGRLSSLYVDARDASHVATVIKFAQEHNLRVSIKNTGHDYFGRSTSPNTLAIWTHNMNTMKYHKDFTASNCPAANGKNIGEMGAGTQAVDAYTYFQTFNMDVTGGNEGSVGLAGGFGQGGGHGVFGPSYGLMVDNAVEFDVVTADGKFRTINQCNDPDLFWAMRGGGGGSFAVLINYRFQLHEAVKINVYSFLAEFKPSSNKTTTNYPVLQEVLTKHATYQPVWSHNNVSGHAYYWPGEVALYFVLPSNNVTALKDLTSEFDSFVSNHPEIVGQSNYTTYDTYTDYLGLTSAIASKLSPGGMFEILASRLVPESLFGTNESVTDLVDAVVKGIQIGEGIMPGLTSLIQIIMTTPVNHQNGAETSVNPAWRSALWHTIMTGGWSENLPPSNATARVEGWLGTIEPLKDITPGGGCYVNEGHYLEPEWQETFFGTNYVGLLEAKKKYDPTHFFDCWKCVGWEGLSDDYYCYDDKTY